FLERSPCPYFPDGRISATEFLLPERESSCLFHKLLSQGYRRLGNIFYRNVCEQCSACRPLRIQIEHFNLSKSQKQTLKKNRDIRLEINAHPSVTAEKLNLYIKYLNVKHADKEKDDYMYKLHLATMHYGYTYAIEIDYFIDDRLIGVGIVDEASDSLSSNYFYYDTDYLHRRLGVFSILKEISLARLIGKKYYYLGFYIEDTPKMSYKKNFRPNQIFENGVWKAGVYK
ncbi:MAG: arginyltransferase, partial [Thermodesulfovibrionia bacterium]|nr:arginyltransferase [Thermodesulfovibrionia bacterium]